MARALLALVEAGARGVTALECSTWAFRLAAYCYDLRRDHGLAIRCDREEHPGGWHGRHVLETPVKIVTVETAEGVAARCPALQVRPETQIGSGAISPPPTATWPLPARPTRLAPATRCRPTIMGGRC
jgi:hypothetical protein